MNKRIIKRNILLFIVFVGICFFLKNDSYATIDDDDVPEFYGTTNITIKTGDNLDIKKSYYRIFAKDKIDGNITKNIQVVRNNVNTNVSGHYTIEYKVTNSRGKTVNLSVPVEVVTNGERKIQRKLYVLPDISHLNDANFYRGNMQDNQNLGFYLPAGVTVKARQINKNCKSKVYISFYNDDALTESTGTRTIYGMQENYDVVGNDTRIELQSDNDNYIDLKNVTDIKIKSKEQENTQENWTEYDLYSKKTYDSVPMVKTIYGIDENPIIEIILNDNIKELDYYTYGDNEQSFKNDWGISKNKFAILDGDRTQFLVPYKDLGELAKSKKGKYSNYKYDNFTTIESILKYYDNIVETYDEWIGLSYNAEESYNQNIKTKFFIKCNIHGAGAAAYAYWEYIYMTSDTLDVFLHKEGDGWAPLHEIGHGYQGILKYLGDLYLGEVSNNFLAYYYQKANIIGEDWLSGFDSFEAVGLVRSTDKSFLEKYNDPSTNEERTGINEFKLKLFAYINVLNKIGAKKAISNTYSYCRYLVSTKQISGKKAIDIIVKGFSDGTGYNVIPYFEDWKVNISDSIKNDIYNKDYPIVYYLRDFVSIDSEARNIKNQLGYPWEFSIISNEDINDYNYIGNLNINLSDEQYNLLKGSQLLLKSGNEIIRSASIDNKKITYLKIPVGIYEIETDSNICSVNNDYVLISKGESVEIDLNITKRKLIEIRIKKEPSRTQYYEGEDFDEKGMIVEAVYNNETTEEVENYRIIKKENLQLNKKSVTIVYTEDGITKRTTQQITVVEKEPLRFETEKYDITDNKYIESIEPNTKIGTFKDSINTNGNIKIYKDNLEITDENIIIATGMKIIVAIFDEKLSYTVVVTGDLMGDGKMDTVDLLKLSRYNAKIDLNLKNEYLRAANVYKDGTYGDTKDILKMSRILANLE